MVSKEHDLFIGKNKKSKYENVLKKISSPIKLQSSEEALMVQKKHWISIVAPMLVHIFVLLIIFLAFFFVAKQGIFPQVSQFLVDITLILLSTLAILGIYAIMDWKFHYYIVTSRRIISVHFFKVKGSDYDEYFFADEAQTEMNRVVSNFIYDLLEVEDIHIGFRSIERSEPFIIATPEKPQEFYGLLEELFMKKRKG